MPRGYRGALFGQMMLAMEAQQVIGLRMTKLAFGGPDAVLEANRMVAEKMNATVGAATMMGAAIASGAPDGGTGKVLHMLRRHVRANRKRLMRYVNAT